MNLLLWIESLEASVKKLHATSREVSATGKVPDLVRTRKTFVREAEDVRAEIEVFHKFALIELNKQIDRVKEQIKNLTPDA
jgi:hypothetical protein